MTDPTTRPVDLIPLAMRLEGIFSRELDAWQREALAAPLSQDGKVYLARKLREMADALMTESSDG